MSTQPSYTPHLPSTNNSELLSPSETASPTHTIDRDPPFQSRIDCSPPAMSNEAGLEPVGHFLVVRMDEPEQVTQGGIVLPQDVTDREEMSGIIATILAIGPEAWSDKPYPWAKVGDRVMISKFAGQLWRVGSTKYRYRVITDLSVAAIIHSPTI